MKTKVKGEVIDLRHKIEVFATKKNAFFKEGQAFNAHPKTAEYFIKHGYATAKKTAKSESVN